MKRFFSRCGMNGRGSLSGFLALFAMLFAGVAFCGIPHRGGTSEQGCVLLVFSVFFAGFYAALPSVARKKPAGSASVFGSAAGFLACLCLYGGYTLRLSKTLPGISAEFSGGRFSGFFVLVSLLLALYAGKQGGASCARLCLLFLPVLLLPCAAAWFDFIDGLQGVRSAACLPPFAPHGHAAEGFCSALPLFGGAVAFLAVGQGKSEKVPVGRKTVFAAFLAALLCYAAEYLKYILWFGGNGLAEADRPDRIMLSQVPFVNIQELFLIFYTVAYLLLVTAVCAAARHFAAEVFSAPVFRRGGARLPYAAAGLGAACAYGCFHAIDQYGFSTELLTAGACLVLFVVTIRRFHSEKPENDEKSDGTTVFPPESAGF